MSLEDLVIRLRTMPAAIASAFRHDPIFRYAALGILVSGLFLIGRLAGPDGTVPGAAPPPNPTALGPTYDAGPVPSAAPAPPAEPPRIAPGRSLDGVRVVPDATAPADHFGRASVPERP